VSHTTKARLGTVFIHDGGYTDSDIEVIPVSFPERVPTEDGSICFSVAIPFEDMRQLVFGYLRDRKIGQLEQEIGKFPSDSEDLTRTIRWYEEISDDELEAELLQ
jgi:hypothetical protein